MIVNKQKLVLKIFLKTKLFFKIKKNSIRITQRVLNHLYVQILYCVDTLIMFGENTMSLLSFFFFFFILKII